MLGAANTAEPTTIAVRKTQTFDATVDVRPVSDTVVIYRLTRKTETTRRVAGKALRPTSTETVEQGICTKQELDNFLKSGVGGIDARAYAVYPAEVMTKLAEIGWPRRSEDFKLFEAAKPEDFKPFDLYEAGQLSRDQIVRVEGGANMLFNVDGDPVPLALTLDWIHAKITEAAYDIPKALKILKSNKQVVFLDEKLDEVPAEKAIQRVPYYQEDRGQQYLQPRWRPTQKQMNELWAWCLAGKTGKPQYPSTRIYEGIFALDMLHLRTRGAALFQNFYESKKRDTCGGEEDEY